MKPNDPSPKLIETYFDGVVLASWLYYRTEHESPWTDTEFDQHIGFLMYWKRLWPNEYKHIHDLKSEAHTLGIEDKDKDRALEWIKSGKHWPN